MQPLLKVIFAIYFIIFGFQSQLFSQNNTVSSATLDFYMNRFVEKGVIVEATEIQDLRHEDLIKIDHFNFDQYRKLNVDQEIVLDGNQKMTLKSLNYLVNQGKQVDQALLTLKSNEINEANLKPMIVRVIVQLGMQKVDSKERWEAQ